MIQELLHCNRFTPIKYWQTTNVDASRTPSTGINWKIEDNEGSNKQYQTNGDHRANHARSPSSLTFSVAQIRNKNKSGNNTHYEASQMTKIINCKGINIKNSRSDNTSGKYQTDTK